VTLVDAYQTILQGCGFEQKGGTPELPGRSWFDIACEKDDLNRISFSEYHAAGSPSGAFMIRKGKYKFIYYVGYEPELFDLQDDPEELVNLAQNEAYYQIVEEYNDDLRGICDPNKTDRQAKDDQNTLIEKFGGRERALHSGTPGATPVPGQGHE
jgi:choline-sulfatase